MDMSLSRLRGFVDGQGGLACCNLWGHKDSDTTERLNWTELIWKWISYTYIYISTLFKNSFPIYIVCVCVCVFSVTQLYLTLCSPVDCSLLVSSVHGIIFARILKWVAISFSRGSSWPRAQTCISCGSYIGRQILYHWANLGSSP